MTKQAIDLKHQRQTKQPFYKEFGLSVAAFTLMLSPLAIVVHFTVAA